VVGSYHRIEFAAHCSHENRVGGKRSLDSRGPRRRREKRRVLVPESAAVTTMRIERAESYARFRDAEPAPQSFTSNSRCLGNRFGGQLLAHLAQWNVRRGENDAKLLGREHHRDASPGQLRQHFRVAGIVVAAGEECGLVYWGRHNAVDVSGHRQFRRALDREASQLSGQLGAAVDAPPPHRFSDIATGSFRANDHNVTALADP
jgi:hypothetical protein